MYGSSYPDNIIKIYVGELIKDGNGDLWLITNLKCRLSDRLFTFININNRRIEELTWIGFRSTYYPVERAGILKGLDILSGEDWLCHDKRCYPSILAGGCSGCMYSKLVKSKKKYFEPGDTVWVPSDKRERAVLETSLFYQHEKGGTPIRLESMYSLRQYEFNDFIWSIRFRLEKYPVTEDNYYRWSEIRLVKRKRHFINPSQLSHICNDLCLFGPYQMCGKINNKCWDCETGKIWKQIT